MHSEEIYKGLKAGLKAYQNVSSDLLRMQSICKLTRLDVVRWISRN